MPIRKGGVRAAGYEVPTVPTGQTGQLIDGAGKVYSTWWEGATQSHPSPLLGGQRIFLGSTGLQEDATNGWNVLTGAAVVSQSATGIDAVLDVTTPEVLIDLPGLGEVVAQDVLLELQISGATPGNGNYAGFRLDSNHAAFTLNSYAISNGTVWHAGGDKNDAAATVGVSGSVAFGDVATIETVTVRLRFTGLDARNATPMIGAMGAMKPWDLVSNITGIASGEDITVPTTWDLALRAKWVSGSDLTVKFISIAALTGALTLSTVD